MRSPIHFDRGHSDDSMTSLTAGPTPYHAIRMAKAKRDERQGFRETYGSHHSSAMLIHAAMSVA